MYAAAQQGRRDPRGDARRACGPAARQRRSPARPDHAPAGGTGLELGCDWRRTRQSRRAEAPDEPLRLRRCVVADRPGRMAKGHQPTVPSAADRHQRSRVLHHPARSAVGTPGQPADRQPRHQGSNIVFARRLEDGGGTFKGIAQAVLSPAYFLDFYQSLALPAGTEVTLFRDDRAVLVRYPAVPDELALRLEKWVSPPPGWGEAEAGSDRAVSQADGAERVESWRRVGRFPIHVAVGHAVPEIEADWRHLILVQGQLRDGRPVDRGAGHLAGVAVGQARGTNLGRPGGSRAPADRGSCRCAGRA